MYANGDRELNDDDKRNAEHEFYVLGLVSYQLHGDEHSNRAAESGEKEEGRFSCSVLRIMLCGYFVITAYDDAYERSCRSTKALLLPTV